MSVYVCVCVCVFITVCFQNLYEDTEGQEYLRQSWIIKLEGYTTKQSYSNYKCVVVVRER